MRILALIQGEYGKRIVQTLKQRGGWTIETYIMPSRLPVVIDNAEEFLPKSLPKADLLLSLGETSGAAQLIPDFAKAAEAAAVIAPIDNHNWLPSGIRSRVKKELDRTGIASAFPKPFCSLTPTGDKVIDRYAGLFGKPELKINVNDVVKEVQVKRGAPCGCTWYVAEKLVGVKAKEATLQAGLFFHNYPCLASMQIDPEVGDTIMHIAGYIVRKAVAEALRAKG
jgi:hypothetical protein